MSFIGVIGSLMDRSGLNEIFELMHASDTVPHFLSGEAISQALWAHTIVDTALNSNLTKEFIDEESDAELELNTENGSA